MAAALLDLGVTAAWVVHSEDGLDEISPYAPTRVSVVADGAIVERVVSPADFGVQPSEPGAIAGGTPEQNAGILQRVLAGEPHPACDALILNAAAALALAGGGSLSQAAERARAAVASGAVLRTLQTWCAASQRAAGIAAPAAQATAS
jgi:anthranilate phosphoribosyltransferase